MARTATERAGAEPGPPESTAPAPDAIAFDEAREGFETVLARIDDMVDQRVTLDPRSYDEWRGRANAAFAAYQTFIDANTPEGRARLDEAHRELARALRALERRVRRDPRRPEWMDAVP
ncbi:MAG: hypothetical protein D6705_06915 [Deltaproteobacteria bacterium]|nr:MAG: hypothetical protein D6705_06915 [Deltaproteobacteria bacterium]